jgi:signal transduction histidine kinase/ActR/RegA family two-component response regulator
MADRPRTRLRVAAALAVVLGVIAALVATDRQLQAQSWVRHTLVVQAELDRLLLAAQAAESAQRAFLLTDDRAFEAEFRAQSALVPAEVERVGDMLGDNADQRARLAALRPWLHERLSVAGQILELRASGKLTPAMLDTLVARGSRDMAGVRRGVTAMADEENRLLVARERDSAQTVLALQAILMLLAVGLSAIGAMVLAQTRGQLALSRTAEAELRELNSALAAEAAARSAAEEQVAHLQRLESLGQLTGGIAHDFNNMLAVIVGSLDLARGRIGTAPERAAAYIESALEGAQRAAQLTARLLAFSRRQPLQPAAIDFNRFVQAASELLRRTLGERVEVETVLAGGLWRAWADPAQLESAIVNLALNGRDAMDGAGRLTLETANVFLDEAYAAAHADVAVGQYVMIAVSDTGHGMNPELVGRVFEPFFTTKETGKGTGLGLSQVYGFIKQSGGTIGIYSELGKGTTVRLYLPRTDATADPTTPPSFGGAGPQNRSPRARGERVLVVEDDPRVRELSAEALRGLGYRVEAAPDAAAAMAQLERGGPVDLLFTDVVMPGATGRELADQVRTRFPTVRVLYTTGYTRNAIVHNGVLDEGVWVLAKPFTLDQLARKVRQALDAGEVVEAAPSLDVAPAVGS